MGILARKTIGVQLQNGRRVQAALEDWIFAILKTMTPEQLTRTLEAVESIHTLHLPTDPAIVGNGVGLGQHEVQIGRPALIQHEPPYRIRRDRRR